MLPLSRLLCPILLALSFLFNTAHAIAIRTTLGYRTVTPAEASAINENQRPVPGNFDGEGNGQLGNNQFYMINTSPAWEAGPDAWYCVVEAEIEALDNADKIWIPEFDDFNRTLEDDVYLWAGDEALIVQYIAIYLDHPTRALRFSWISFVENDPEPILQMVIPPEIIEDRSLDLWARCFSTQEELRNYSPLEVDWLNWEDILGEPGDPPPPLIH
ncbi:hypothetical protein LZ554_004276 [Drepanopeziza brunnea f. sp. 'monogermtubi']|nr:hypothetical protein LZ554_004276 [Drepanopeziza brunnea f. sp. 'monogermtubi']